MVSVMARQARHHHPIPYCASGMKVVCSTTFMASGNSRMEVLSMWMCCYHLSYPDVCSKRRRRWCWTRRMKRRPGKRLIKKGEKMSISEINQIEREKRKHYSCSTSFYLPPGGSGGGGDSSAASQQLNASIFHIFCLHLKHIFYNIFRIFCVL